MKKCYLIVLSIIFFKVSFSAPIITASVNGYWNSTSTWDLNRLPQIGDTIVIPLGKIVTINDDQSFNGFVYIKIYGKLAFEINNSTLRVITPSVINVFNSGQILGGGSASQKIRFDNTAIFTGTDAPVLGPSIASGASAGFSNSGSIILPVKFNGFTLSRQKANILIQWATSEEMNADIYQIERSIDGTNWNTIAYVAAMGNRSVINNYSFTDKNISEKVVYYRIKEIDLGGKETSTTIRSVKTEVSSTTVINIAGIQKKVLLQFPEQIQGNITVRFLTASGQIVDQQNINNPVGQVVLNSKVTGNYIISISNGKDINTAKQVIL